MKDIDCTLVSADESCERLGSVDLAAAVDAFRSFPWQEEVAKVDETGCFPAMSLGAGPNGKGGYMNITGCEDGAFSVMVETYKRVAFLGFIPWKKSAFRELEPLDAQGAEDCIRQLFELPQEMLFDWIKKQGEPE